MQDVDNTEESDDAWSTAEEEEDLAALQVDFRLFQDLARAPPMFSFTVAIDDDDPPSVEPESEYEGNDDFPPPEPVSDDEPCEPQLPDDASVNEDNVPFAGSEDERPRPPFVTDGRGRVIGASDGSGSSESARQRASETTTGNTEGLPRTFLGRFMDAFCPPPPTR